MDSQFFSQAEIRNVGVALAIATRLPTPDWVAYLFFQDSLLP